VEALQAVSPELGAVEPKLIRVLERASGLKGLRFEAETPADDRLVQSMLDKNGRIVGWFSWESERPATATMLRLLPVAAVIALRLFGFALLAMWQLRRLGFLLAKSERDVHKLEYEDPLTGLPNGQQMVDVLDYAISERSAEEMVAFAIVDLEGFDDARHAVGD